MRCVAPSRSLRESPVESIIGSRFRCGSFHRCRRASRGTRGTPANGRDGAAKAARSGLGARSADGEVTGLRRSLQELGDARVLHRAEQARGGSRSSRRYAGGSKHTDGSRQERIGPWSRACPDQGLALCPMDPSSDRLYNFCRFRLFGGPPAFRSGAMLSTRRGPHSAPDFRVTCRVGPSPGAVFSSSQMGEGR